MCESRTNCNTGSVSILVESSIVKIGRLQWEYGIPGEEVSIKGEDVARIVNGRIQQMYTFVDV